MKTIKVLSTVFVVAIVAIATAVEKPKMNVVPLADDSVVLIQPKNEGVVYFQQSAKWLGNLVADDDLLHATSLKFVEVQETNLEIESWMTSSSFWNIQTEILEIENWMINEDIWKLENSSIGETETEQELSIENWMTNEKIWKI